MWIFGEAIPLLQTDLWFQRLGELWFKVKILLYVVLVFTNTGFSYNKCNIVTD